MMALAKLHTLLQLHDKVGQQIADEAEKVWPPGSRIEWTRGGHHQSGTVIEHRTRGGDVRLLCENHRTGKHVHVNYSRHTHDFYGS